MPRQKSQHVDDPRAVGRRLRAARQAAGVSQRQLSFVGCTPAYISRIESGERIPSLQLLRELGRRLGVTAEYLATGQEEAVAVAGLSEAEILLRLDRVDEAERLYEQELADAATDAERSRALEGLGQIASRRGDLRQAVELLESAVSLARGDSTIPTSAAQTLAQSYAGLGQLAEAIALLRRAVDAFAEQRDWIQFVRFSSLLGSALTDTGAFGEAETVVASALERGREIRDPNTRARLYWSESRLRAEQGQSDLAERYAQKTVETLRATEDELAIAQAMQALAHIYIERGRASDAIEVLREGAPLLERAGSPLETAQYRIEEARALSALGEKEEAARVAMQVADELGDAHPVDAGRTYLLLGGIFAEIGERGRARDLYELAIERLEDRGPTRYLVSAYKAMGVLLREDGHVEEALALLERALGVQDAAGRPLS